ncbi:MAG: protein-L-isoaspartate O-methyltransferase [Robiginitomaculum sp.]|nr:protein-L-isoaspartate O-methyltransferase [Robiginitomaculum sp.]
MNNTAAARQAMVDGQVRVNDVTDPRVQAVMLAVERDVYIPKAQRAAAYSDVDVKLAEGRYLMKPRDFAKLLQALEVEAGDLVLDIGTATGYSAVVLSQLAETVVALEEDEALAAQTEKAMGPAAADNVAVIHSNFLAGVPDQAPFDVIFVNGAVVKTPTAWLHQLADGGRLAVIERDGPAGQGVIYTRSGGVIGRRVVFDALTPYLPGFAPVQQFVF